MVRHTDANFIDVAGVAITLMRPLQSTSVYGSEFDTGPARLGYQSRIDALVTMNPRSASKFSVAR